MATDLQLEKDRPVVLIVDDLPKTRNKHRKLFEAFGFETIIAEDESEAMRELTSTPAIDLLFTDVCLHPEVEPGVDRSGLELARDIRKRRSSLPIVVYSGIVEDNVLPDAERDDNFEWLPKTVYGAKEWEDRMGIFGDRAASYRESRRATAERELARVQAAYDIREVDLEILRNFMPSPQSTAHPSLEDESVDAILNRLGYRLHFVETGNERPTEEGNPAVTTGPILIWVRAEADGYVAELYQHPSIYAYADSGDEAIRQALILMDGFHRDLCSGEEPESDELRSLFNYLQLVFGGPDAANDN